MAGSYVLLTRRSGVRVPHGALFMNKNTMVRRKKKIRITEGQLSTIKSTIRESKLNEKMGLKNWDGYVKLVSDAYDALPSFEQGAVKHWNALNKSNHTLFKRLLSKADVIFYSNEKSRVGSVNILGRNFKIIYMAQSDEYQTQTDMKKSFNETQTLKISIDFSDHPIFSVSDNIVFRTVHDYMTHILGNHPFGTKGEIAAYNRHVKLAPKEAVPALFTEVVGQVCSTVIHNRFPEQKIGVLTGFDYHNLGEVDDADYEVKDKTLSGPDIKNTGDTEAVDSRDDNPSAVFQPDEPVK